MGNCRLRDGLLGSLRVKIVVLTKHEHLGLPKHRGYKVVLRQDLGPELVFREYGWIHVPPEALLRSLNRGYDVAEGHVADDQQIDVTGGMKLTACGRTEDERRADTISQGRQRLAQNVHESNGLGEQALQLWKDGCFLIRLKVHLLAANLALHQARSRQQFQLALNCADRAADAPHEFPQVVRFIRVTQEPSQDAPPRAAEQDGCGIERRRSCSQDGDKRIQNGNARSTVRQESGSCIGGVPYDGFAPSLRRFSIEVIDVITSSNAGTGPMIMPAMAS